MAVERTEYLKSFDGTELFSDASRLLELPVVSQKSMGLFLPFMVLVNTAADMLSLLKKLVPKTFFLLALICADTANQDRAAVT